MAQIWDTNTFAEIQYEYSFAAFVPNTLVFISTENYYKFTDSNMWRTEVQLDKVSSPIWGSYINTLHGEKGTGQALDFGEKRKSAGCPQQRNWSLCTGSKRSSGPAQIHLHCTRFSKGKEDFLQGSWLDEEGGKHSV